MRHGELRDLSIRILGDRDAALRHLPFAKKKYAQLLEESSFGKYEMDKALELPDVSIWLQVGHFFDQIRITGKGGIKCIIVVSGDRTYEFDTWEVYDLDMNKIGDIPLTDHPTLINPFGDPVKVVSSNVNGKALINDGMYSYQGPIPAYYDHIHTWSNFKYVGEGYKARDCGSGKAAKKFLSSSTARYHMSNSYEEEFAGRYTDDYVITRGAEQWNVPMDYCYSRNNAMIGWFSSDPAWVTRAGYIDDGLALMGPVWLGSSDDGTGVIVAMAGSLDEIAFGDAQLLIEDLEIFMKNGSVLLVPLYPWDYLYANSVGAVAFNKDGKARVVTSRAAAPVTYNGDPYPGSYFASARMRNWVYDYKNEFAAPYTVELVPASDANPSISEIYYSSPEHDTSAPWAQVVSEESRYTDTGYDDVPHGLSAGGFGRVPGPGPGYTDNDPALTANTIVRPRATTYDGIVTGMQFEKDTNFTEFTSKVLIGGEVCASETSSVSTVSTNEMLDFGHMHVVGKRHRILQEYYSSEFRFALYEKMEFLSGGEWVDEDYYYYNSDDDTYHFMQVCYSYQKTTFHIYCNGVTVDLPYERYSTTYINNMAKDLPVGGGEPGAGTELVNLFKPITTDVGYDINGNSLGQENYHVTRISVDASGGKLLVGFDVYPKNWRHEWAVASNTWADTTTTYYMRPKIVVDGNEHIMSDAYTGTPTRRFLMFSADGSYKELPIPMKDDGTQWKRMNGFVVFNT